MSADVRVRLSVTGQAQVNSALSDVRGGVGQIADSSERASDALKRVGHYAAGAFAIGGLSQVVRGIAAMADEYATLNGRLRTVAGSQAEFAAAQRDVADIAERQRKGLTEIGTLYASASAAAGELGANQQQIAKFTEGVAASLTVNGTAAQAASGALLQLSQAIGGSVVQAQEFNSLIDGARPLLVAAAKHIDEAGGSVSRLKTMVNEGRLSSREFFEAIVQGSDELIAASAGMPVTIGQAITLMRNEWMQYVGALDAATGASSGAASIIAGVARNLDVLAAVAGVAASVALGRMAQAAGTSAAALLAQRAASVAALAATVRQTEAVAIHTGFVLADARATLAHAQGLGASVVAQNAVTAASARHTAALAAQSAAQLALNRATSAGSLVMGVLGGPIGAITTLLGLGATAWALWGARAKETVSETETGVIPSTERLLVKMREEVALLERRAQLKAGGIAPERQGDDGQLATLQALSQRIQDIQARKGEFWSLNAAQATAAIREASGLYGQLAAEIDRAANAKAALNAVSREQAMGEWMGKYATDAEKLAAELKEAAKAFGGVVPPEIEQRIRARFIKPARDATNAYADLSGSIRKIIDTEQARLAAGGDLSRAQQLEIDLTERLNDALAKLSPGQRDRVRALIAQAVAGQQAADAAELQAKSLAELERARRAEAETMARQQQAGEQELQQLRDRYVEITAGSEALDALVNLRLEDAAAIHEEKAATLALFDAGSAAVEHHRILARNLREQITLRKGIASATASREAEAANRRAADDAVDVWQTAADQVGQSLADALMQGGKSAAEYIKGLFRTMVLRPVIQAVVQPIADAVMQMLGMGGKAGSSGLSMNSVSSLMSQGASLARLGSGFAAVGTSVANAAGTTYANMAGTGLDGFLATNNAFGTAAGGAGGWGTALGTGASYLAGAAVGVYGGRAISNGYSVSGDSGNRAVNIGTAIGALAGPIGAAIGGIIGGIANRAFGRKAPAVESQYLKGSIGGSGFSGSIETNTLAKGGWFRSDKRGTTTDAITGELDQALDAGALQLQQLAKRYAEALGLPAAHMASATREISIKLTADAAANGKAVQDALASYADQLFAGHAAVLGPLRRAGEEIQQTAERVGTALAGVNAVLGNLGMESLQAQAKAAGLAGSPAPGWYPPGLRAIRDRSNEQKAAGAAASAAVSLADAFGGIDNLAQAAGSFYGSFFTETERAARSTELVTEALAGVNLALPASREAFRAVVEGLDLTAEADRERFVVLMNVAGAFAELNPLIDDTAAGLADTANAARDALAQRNRLEVELMRLQGDTAGLRARELAALDESNRALQRRVWALGDEQERLRALADAGQGIAEFLRTLAGGSGGVPTLASARAAYAEDLRLAQGGDAGASGRIPGSAAALVEQLRDTARNPIDLARATSRMAAELQALPATLSWQQQVLASLAQVIGNTAGGGPLAQAMGAALAEAKATLVLTLDSALPEDLKQIALRITDTVQRTVRFVADAEALPADLRTLAVQSQKNLLVSVQATLAANLPDDVRALALNAQHTLTTTVQAVLAADASADAKRLALQAGNSYLTVVNAALSAALPDDVRRLALQGAGEFTATVVAVLGAPVPDEIRQLALSSVNAHQVMVSSALSAPVSDDIRRLALTSASAHQVAVGAVLSADVSDAVKRIALQGLSIHSVTVSAALAAALPEDVQRLALSNGSAYLVLVSTAMAAPVSEDIRRLALSGANFVTATVGAVLAASVPDAVKRLALAEQSQHLVTVQGLLSESIPADLRALLLQSNTEASRAVLLSASLASALTPDQKALLDTVSGTVRRVVEQVSQGGEITADQRALLLAAPATVRRVVEQLLSSPNLTDDQRTILGAVSKEVTTVLKLEVQADIPEWLQTLLAYLNDPGNIFVGPTRPPGYAAGGLHAGGMRIVGERGPELEVTGPARIYSASQTADMLQGGSQHAVVAELRALRSEMQDLRAEQAAGLGAVAQYTNRTATMIDRVTEGGSAMITTPA